MSFITRLFDTSGYPARWFRERYPLIPTILITAVGSEEIAVCALQNGAASYAPKRRLTEDLRDTMLRVLAA